MTPRLPIRPRQLFRPQWAISIAAALAAIGFLGTGQWNSSLAREEFVSSAQGVLVTRAEQLQREQERLQSDLEASEADLQALRESAAGSETQMQQLNAQLAEARVAAGVVELRGPGVVIEIGDSLRPVPAGERQENYLVLGDDLRDIVTALWGSGAEAIAISGSLTEGAPSTRLVATSSIFGAGGAILVNGVPLSAPYRMTAIGPDGLRDRFLTHPAFLARVVHRVDAYSLQFATEARGEVTVPGFIGFTRMIWGVAIEEPL